MKKFFIIVPLLSIFFAVFFFTSCEQWFYDMFDYGEPTPTYIGSSHLIGSPGGWLIETDTASELYGCSVYLSPMAMEDNGTITVSMSIDNTVPYRDAPGYPDFEPKWVSYAPVGHEFNDTISIGLCWKHLPHNNSYIMEFVEYLPNTKSFKVHTITSRKIDAQVAYIDTKTLGVFALFPGAN